MEIHSFQSLANWPSNNRFLFFLFYHCSYEIVKLPRGTWLITIKPVRLLHSISCVKTPKAQNRSEDWQLPLPQDKSLLLVLICASAYACGGVSISYRRGLGTLVRISQLALIEWNKQVSGAAVVHSMLCVYYGGCEYRIMDITLDTVYSIGVFCFDAQFWIVLSIRCLPSILPHTVAHSQWGIP